VPSTPEALRGRLKRDLKFWVEYEYADDLRHGRANVGSPPVIRAGNLVVKVGGVPDYRFDGHVPKRDVIWQAEAAFLRAIENDLPPASLVVGWRLFINSKDGPFVSEYRLYCEDELRGATSHRPSFHRTT
jgi:hypothetical protein